MIVDSHEHIMLPTEKQINVMDEAGVSKTILFCSAPHPEHATSLDEIEAEINALIKFYPGQTVKKPILRGRRKI